MNRLKLFCIIFLIIPALSGAHTCEVFVIHSMPVTNSFNNDNITKIYYLDEMVNLQKSMSEVAKNGYLVGGEKTAIKSVKEFAENNKNKYKKSAEALIKAKQYNVLKIPSVVIDGKYQIIGTTDIDLAMSKYKSYKALNEGADR